MDVAAASDVHRLRDLIWDESVYAGFPKELFRSDMQGWGSDHPIFEALIQHVQPGTILELGTWKGRSAINMARICADQGVPLQELVCVDTWLGGAVAIFDINHNLEVGRDESGRPRRSSFASDLRPVWGFPTLYHTFMANVVDAGFQDVITPLPISTNEALLVLQAASLRYDLIYVDASHLYEGARADIEGAWPLLSERGVMFGDDFSWPGVRQAAIDAATQLGRRVVATSDGYKWMIPQDERALIDALGAAAPA